jgi:general secretion pathway protein D
MGFTCKNFVYGAGIGGRSSKVTIIAPKKMSPRQAWQVFLVALETMNITVVPKGNVLTIVETPQAKNEPLPIYRKGGPAATSQMVRMVMRPENIPVDELSTAINALKSKDGTVTPVPKAGILVVTDYGNVITKMRQLMAEVDIVPMGGEQLYMIKIHNADSTEIAAKLQEILGTADSDAPPSNPRSRSRSRSRGKTPEIQIDTSDDEVASAVPSKIIADERTNSLIVLASEPAYLRVRALVKRMDLALEVEGGSGRIHVYYLENADAEEMGNTLTAVISGIQQPAGGTTRTSRQTRDRRSTSRAGASDGSAPAFEGQVRVTHDKPTNALVVVASVKDFLALRDVIRKLDVPRRQVFIEAVILEVKADNSRDLGFSYHGGADLDNGAIALGGLQHANLSSLNVASLASSTGLLGGVIGPLLENAPDLLGTSLPSFGVLFQALANSSNVNVLSSPHILTTDNEEAEISVGENIPYQSSFSNFGVGGQGGGGGGFGFPVQSVQRQDVALTLKITPHVNASDMVRLEIDQEISDIASPNFEGLGPSWAKRTIKTTVVVRDQQSIVIGGLMSDRTTYTESKIPLLGDVPLLGYLFKYTQKSVAKTNLLVLLTPYIIKDQMDIEQIVQRKVRERSEFMRSFSNFSRMEFQTNIDYRRKRGLVEEINRTVRMIEDEAELLRQLEQKGQEFLDGPIEYNNKGEQDGAAPAPVTDASDAKPAADSGAAKAQNDAKPAAKGDAKAGAGAKGGGDQGGAKGGAKGGNRGGE